MVTSNINEIERFFNNLENNVNDTEAHLHSIGEKILNKTYEAFNTQKDPVTNEAWQPIKETTYNRSYSNRRRDERTILRDTGDLFSSLNYNVSNNTLTIGSNLAYSAIHNFGGNAGKNRSVLIPKRRFLPIKDNEDLDDNLTSEILEELSNNILE